jgi:hypothetical protein
VFRQSPVPVKWSILARVFRAPRDWTSQAAGDGGILFHPSGPAAGHIRVLRHGGAIGRLPDLVAERLGELGQYTADAVEPARVIVTEEGEPAALIATRGRLGAEAAEAVVGLVILPSEVAAVTGVASAAAPGALADAVREVTTSLALGRAGAAARRFLYAPPRGWHPRPTGPEGLATIWYPPDFPRPLATLTVSPAEHRPPTGTPQHIVDAIQAADQSQGFSLEQSLGPDAIASDFGLSGQAFTLVGVPRGQPRLVRDLAVLIDADHAYTIILTSLSAEDRQAPMPALREVVRTAHPATGFGELTLS